MRVIQGTGAGPAGRPAAGGGATAAPALVPGGTPHPLAGDLAAIVADGAAAGAFLPPAAIDDFTLRFSAMVDGLSILRMRQMHQPTRKRLVQLAMTTARAELAPPAG